MGTQFLDRMATVPYMLPEFYATVKDKMGTPPVEELPDGQGAKAAAFALTMTVESASSQALTTARLNTQYNGIYGTQHRLKLPEYFKGYSFFWVMRLSQFSAMNHAKEWGTALSKRLNPDASESTHNGVGGFASSLVGLSFSYPMERVVLEGVKSSQEGISFNLGRSVKRIAQQMMSRKATGMLEVGLRDLPLGACLTVGVPAVNAALTTHAGDLLSVDQIQVIAPGATAVGFCTATQPFDYIKAKLQYSPQLPNNGWTVARQVFKESGVKPFMTGLPDRIKKNVMTFLLANLAMKKVEEVFSRI